MQRCVPGGAQWPTGCSDRVAYAAGSNASAHTAGLTAVQLAAVGKALSRQAHFGIRGGELSGALLGGGAVFTYAYDEEQLSGCHAEKGGAGSAAGTAAGSPPGGRVRTACSACCEWFLELHELCALAGMERGTSFFVQVGDSTPPRWWPTVSKCVCS